MNDLLAGSVAMSVVDVVAIVDAIADALDFAQGLLHRDVKPANIFMTAGAFASQRRILLADFGIGREIAHTGGLTATNMTVGTVSYAAPEQFGTPPWVQRGRRVPLRLQHDRLVEVSHASRVQPAARDLVQIRRRPSVLPRRSDGLVHHEVGGDVEFALEAVALLYEFDRTPCAGRARSRTHRNDEVFDDVRPVRPDVRAAVLTISSRPAPLLLLGHSSLAVAPAHARSVAHGSDMSLKRVCLKHRHG